MKKIILRSTNCDDRGEWCSRSGLSGDPGYYGIYRSLAFNPDFQDYNIYAKRLGNRNGRHGNGHDRILWYKKKPLYRSA